jgi:hypothetical protein
VGAQADNVELPHLSRRADRDLIVAQRGEVSTTPALYAVAAMAGLLVRSAIQAKRDL